MMLEPSPTDELDDRIADKLAKLEELGGRLSDGQWHTITERVAEWSAISPEAGTGKRLVLAFLNWAAAYPERVGNPDEGPRRRCRCTDGWIFDDVSMPGSSPRQDKTVRCTRCRPDEQRPLEWLEADWRAQRRDKEPTGV